MVTPGDIVAEAGRRLLREGYSIHHAQDAIINGYKMVSWASAYAQFPAELVYSAARNWFKSTRKAVDLSLSALPASPAWEMATRTPIGDGDCAESKSFRVFFGYVWRTPATL